MTLKSKLPTEEERLTFKFDITCNDQDILTMLIENNQNITFLRKVLNIIKDNIDRLIEGNVR